MTLFVAAGALTVILALVVWYVVSRYQQKREKRSMRDHLHRISQASE